MLGRHRIGGTGNPILAFQLDESAVPRSGFHTSIMAYCSARISARTTGIALFPGDDTEHVDAVLIGERI